MMAPSPIISIIVAIYNAQSFLDKCVKSILEQSFTDFELILIDDGSTDDSPQICDHWAKKDARVSVIHQDNQGVRKATVVGIEVARGAYIGFVDSDDWVLPEMFMDMYQAVQKYNADCVRCGIHMVDPNGTEEHCIESDRLIVFTKPEIECQILHPFWEEDANLYKNWSNGRWDKLYRTELLKRILPWLSMNVSMGEDVEINLWYLSLCNTVVTLRGACNYYNLQNPNSMTHAFSEKALISTQEYIKALEEIRKKQGRKGKALGILSDRLYADVCFQALTGNGATCRQRYTVIQKASCAVRDKQIFFGNFESCNFAVRTGMRLIGSGKVKTAVYCVALFIQAVRRLRRMVGRR